MRRLGTGTEKDPLSVTPGSFDGITARALLLPDGEEDTFDLPGNFMHTKLAIIEINGLGQEPNVDYLIDEENNTITFAEVPDIQDNLAVYYTKLQQTMEI